VWDNPPQLKLLDWSGICDWVKVVPDKDNCFKILVLFQFKLEFKNKFSAAFEIFFDILFCISELRLFWVEVKFVFVLRTLTLSSNLTFLSPVK
jgi:hypothetical protein